MRLTVLGKSPAWQDAGGACSGYLVEAHGARALLDCGPGVFGRLRAVTDHRGVDTVVLSHLHADHVLDVVPFASALAFGPPPHRERAPLLLGPPGTTAALRALCAAARMSEDHVERTFGVHEYDPAAPASAGPFGLRFCPVPHYVPCNAVEVRVDGVRLVFGADCAPNDALPAFAAGADLLLLEATLPEPEPEGPRGHMTAAEAGALGRRAGARRLVITHISDELDLAAAQADAERAFGGPVDVAAGGAVYQIASP